MGKAAKHYAEVKGSGTHEVIMATSVADARAKWIAANPAKDASKLKIRKPLETLRMGRR